MLILQTLCIILKKNNLLKIKAFEKVKKKSYLSKAFPLLRTLQIILHKRFKFSIGKIGQPRLTVRRRWEDPEIAELYKERSIKTAETLMESLMRKKLKIDYIETVASIFSYFTV